MCYNYSCELKFHKPNRAITFLRIYKSEETGYYGRRCISEKVISQIKIKLKGTKNTLRKAHPIFIREMNTAIRKAKKMYPNLKKF